MYSCNANKLKQPSFTICTMHLLYGTAELFADIRRNLVFTSVGSDLSGISGSTRDALCLNSFVDRPDLLSG